MKPAILETTLRDVTIRQQRIGDPAWEEKNPPQLPPKPTTARVQPYHQDPHESFVAWRARFVDAVGSNRWTTAEAKSFAFLHMVGKAQESVLHISPKVDSESLETFLDRYQKVFAPAARSKMYRAQFACIKQLPGESAHSLHSRMKVLYHLAYPDKEDRKDGLLLERFIAALDNCDVQNFVRKGKPQDFEDALDAAKRNCTEEEAVAEIDGGPAVLGRCDVSTLDAETIAGISTDLTQKDPSYGEDDEEDFPDGQ